MTQILFQSFSKNIQPREERLVEAFRKPETKLYVQFLHAVLPCFDLFNVLLQTEAPVIHKLHPAAMKLYKVRLKRISHIMCHGLNNEVNSIYHE